MNRLKRFKNAQNFIEAGKFMISLLCIGLIWGQGSMSEMWLDSAATPVVKSICRRKVCTDRKVIKSTIKSFLARATSSTAKPFLGDGQAQRKLPVRSIGMRVKPPESWLASYDYPC